MYALDAMCAVCVVCVGGGTVVGGWGEYEFVVIICVVYGQRSGFVL